MHKPTPEQEAIIDRAVSTKDSILINALAGAAKTTTLEMICQALPVQPILSLAFNKRIADELGKRLPGHVQCRTLNSIGHRAWMTTCSKRITLDTDKNYKILRGIIDTLPRSDKAEAFSLMADFRKAVSKAKLSGYVPEGAPGHAKRLTDEIPWDGDEELNGFEWIINDALLESIRQAYAGNIDFDDQIYMPTLFGGQFPRFPLVMGDEVQDWSRLNHEMVKKLYAGRIMGVGDPYQSIYAFRGAYQNGMEYLRDTFSMSEMNLSISFRCPRAVIERARFRAPHMMWPEWAKEGQVTTLEEWGPEAIPDGAAIICRNNAPLFKVALALLRNGRGINLIGFDIGPSLVRIMKKLGPESMSQAQTIDAIHRWESETLRKKGEKGAAIVTDKAECLLVFAKNGENLAAAIAYAEDIFKQKGPIQLCSGHKSKGLEWDTVFHLDPWRVPSKFATSHESKEQELNVRYVIETRPKDSLFLANAEDFGGND